MLRPFILILILFQFGICFAQRAERGDSISGININLAYNSSVIYPGISAGIEFPVRRINMRNFADRNEKYIKTKFLAGNLNWYHHPGFHDNLYITAEYIMRRTRSNGYIWEFSAGPGFSHTFLGGTTYKVDNDGNVTIIRYAGYNYAMLTIGGGFGYDFSVQKKMPASAFCRLNIITMFPYNSTIYFRPVLAIGLRYSLRSRLK